MPTKHYLACEMVEQYERKGGRKAKNVTTQPTGYDVVGDRNIEVKATAYSKIPPTFYFSEPYWNRFKKDPKAWLYIVYDMAKKPKLIKLPRDAVLKFKTKSYQEIIVYMPSELRKAFEEDFEAGIEL